jgi:hypothetical protein
MKRFLLAHSEIVYKKEVQPSPVVLNTKRNISFSSFRLLFIATVLFSSSIVTYAQQDNEQQKAEYKKVIAGRAAKIVNTLEITDSGKYQKVLTEISNQYFALNDIQEQAKVSSEAIKTQSLSKDAAAEALKKQDEEKLLQLKQLHSSFITHLKESLTESQLEKVKDGMTYSILPITYAAYLDMLLNLTTEQKSQIYTWLTEARELAMDAESSDKKHAVFGKYKGRINNYLSAAGYDMKKEGEEWQKRIKEREAAKKGNNASQ